jgi:hypothetical protein
MTRTEQVYGQFRTAMLAGNEEYSAGRIAAAHAHFGVSVILARRLMLLAGAGLSEPDMALRAVAEASGNAARCLMRLDESAKALNGYLASCRYLCAWTETGGTGGDFRCACHASLAGMLETADDLHRRVSLPPDEVAEIRSRLVMADGAA